MAKGHGLRAGCVTLGVLPNPSEPHALVRTQGNNHDTKPSRPPGTSQTVSEQELSHDEEADKSRLEQTQPMKCGHIWTGDSPALWRL